MKIVLLILGSLFVALANTHHYEKFFEIDGGPEYMYYFAKFDVGSQEAPQSAILDTGSDTLAFPCNTCQSRNCGNHQDYRFQTNESKTFNYHMSCYKRYYYGSTEVCRFQKKYAEGSSLNGFLAEDYVRFKNSRPIADYKIDKFNEKLKNDLKLKAEFGCTTKETGLFKSQYADGILGLDDGSSFISSMEQDNSLKNEKVFSFGLCFHKTGGIMSIDLRNKYDKDDKITMLDKNINQYQNPLKVKYNTLNNYYQMNVLGFELDGKKFNQGSMTMMIDSGTTFTHLPTIYMQKFLDHLTEYCRKRPNECGRIPNVHFKGDSCVELQQPDENYLTVNELLNSFPSFQMHFEGANMPYTLHPKNYFYEEYLTPQEKSQGIMRLCFAVKAEGEEDKIILGAFSMIDYYFYFDRKEKQMMIFRENCYVRTRTILKRERILEEIVSSKMGYKFFKTFAIVGTLVSIGAFYLKQKKKTN